MGLFKTRVHIVDLHYYKDLEPRSFVL